MPLRPKILDILGSAPGAAPDEALLEALLRVPEETQAEIIRILVKRGQDPALAKLIGVYDKLPANLRSIVLTSTSQLFGALRLSIRSPNPQHRLNTLDLIRGCGNLRLAYLATLALHDASPRLRKEAAETLLLLVERHVAAREEVALLLREIQDDGADLRPAIASTLRIVQEERQYVSSAVADALGTFETHHRPEIVWLGMLLADELEQPLFQHSTIVLGKLTHAVQEIFVSRFSPRLAGFCYIALCYPELRKRILNELSRCRDAEFFHEFIRLHWMNRDPNIRRGLSAVKSLDWLGDWLDEIFKMPPEIAAAAPAWLDALGLSSDQKVALLTNLLLLENPDAARAALWALTEIKTPASTLALQAALDHEEPDLRRIARNEITHRRRSAANTRAIVSDRPTPWNELLAQADLTEEFDDFWQHFDRIDPALARQAGQFAFRYLKDLTAQTVSRLHSYHAAERLRAIRFVMALQLPERFSTDLFNAANDPAPEVRAAAMTAVGRIGDATSRRILERALTNDEPQVQAAVIEALDLMGAPRRVELFGTFLEHDHSAVRQAAVTALLKLRVAEGATALLAMLVDAREDHRCAALWIADQLKLTSIAPRLKEMAQRDADHRVARIALHVWRRLNRTTPDLAVDAHAPHGAAPR